MKLRKNEEINFDSAFNYVICYNNLPKINDQVCKEDLDQKSEITNKKLESKIEIFNENSEDFGEISFEDSEDENSKDEKSEDEEQNLSNVMKEETKEKTLKKINTNEIQETTIDIIETTEQSMDLKQKNIETEINSQEEEINQLEKAQKACIKFAKITSLATLDKFLKQFRQHTLGHLSDYDAFIKEFLQNKKKPNTIKICFGLFQNYCDFEELKNIVLNKDLTTEENLLKLNSLFGKIYQSEATKDYSIEINCIIQSPFNIHRFLCILKSEAVQQYYTSDLKEVCYIKTKYQADLLTFKLTYGNLAEVIELIIQNIIIMPLSQGAKGITTSFLKIAINSKWIVINQKGNDLNEFSTLLAAYVFITLFHESNHFLRRYYNQEEKVLQIETPGGQKKKEDGGELMFEYLFGHRRINHISYAQALKLLDLNYWKDIELLKTIFAEKDLRGSSISYMTNKTSKKQSFGCVVREANRKKYDN